MHESTLITGGAGFIGSNYVRHVATRRDHPIIVFDKLTYAGNIDNIDDLIKDKSITFIEGDIADKNGIEKLFKEHSIATVINFAAETHVDRSIAEPGIFVQTNIVGTYNLLEASRSFEVPRYHQISTDEVYGDLGDTENTYFTEQTPLAPNCPYAACKASADLLVRSYFETYRMHTTISRCSNNYGPYQFPEKLIPLFFTRAQNNEPLPIYGDGKNVRDWLYVTDHCTAIDLIVEKGAPGEIYNIGGHNEKNNLEIARLILRFLDKPESLITFVEDRRAHDRRYAMDPKKIERELGWWPAVSFEPGIEKTFAWYAEHKEWCQTALSNFGRSLSRR